MVKFFNNTGKNSYDKREKNDNIEEKKYAIYHFSAQGWNHIKKDTVCQDSSFSYENKNSSVKIIVVADGHGGDDYVRSDIGSKIATEVAIDVMLEFVKEYDKNNISDIKDANILKSNIAEKILQHWRKKVNDHYDKNLLSLKEANTISANFYNKYIWENSENRDIGKIYGSTLIAFVITDEFNLGIQIGDGKCVLITENGNIFQPIPEDKQCAFNVTTSLCDDNAVENFRYYSSDDSIAGVFIGTDGVDNSFNNDEELHELYKAISYLFVSKSKTDLEEEIEKYLHILTKKGSGDDISLAWILNKEMLEKTQLLRNIIEKEKEHETIEKINDSTLEQIE